MSRNLEARALHRSPFAAAGLLYLRILTVVLAAVGLGFLLGMQTGWLKLASEVENASIENGAGEGDLSAVLTLEGDQFVFSDRLVPVESGRVYKLSGEFRIVADGPRARSSARINFGVDSFDENREPVREGRANHRYPGARNIRLSSLQGWVSLEGRISFDGEGHGRFRGRTAYVAPGFRIDQGDGAVVQVRNVVFGEVVQLRD